MLFVDGFASNDKMQRFKHHTEQQVYHTSKDLQQSPYTGKDSQQVGIVFILDGKTEYTNCMIQTVNDPSLSQKNITDSMISSFPSMHPPRICCHLFPTSVFCVLSSGESGIGPVSVFDKRPRKIRRRRSPRCLEASANHFTALVSTSRW